MNDNTSELRQISIRLRELREDSDQTIAYIASELNIPVEKYLKYESGDADIPVSVLYTVSKILNVELTTLLTGEEPHLNMYSLVRKGKGTDVQRKDQYKYISLADKFIGKCMEPLYVTVPGEWADRPISTSFHDGQEYNYVLKGEVEIVIGGKQVILYEGDSLYFDSKYPHGMRARGGADAIMLVVILQ